MSIGQESAIDILSAEEIEELERQTHEALTPWVDEHVRTGHGQVSDLGYDRERYSFQRLDRPYIPPADKLYGVPMALIPTSLLMAGIQLKIDRSMGGIGGSRRALKLLKETPATEDSQKSIAEEFELMLEEGRSLAVISDHLKKGDLRDIGLIVGLLICSVGSKKARENSSLMIGFNITREAFGKHKKPSVEHITQAMGAVKVMQNSTNRRALAVTDLATKIINDGAREYIKTIGEKGGAMGVVPAGSTTLFNTEEGYYRRPETRPAASTLMAFSGILPVAMEKGRILPGPMALSECSSDMIDRDIYLEKITMVSKALTSLALNDAILTGHPVVFEDINRRWMMIDPSGKIGLASSLDSDT